MKPTSIADEKPTRLRLFATTFLTTMILFIVDFSFKLSGDTQHAIIFAHGQNMLADFFNHILYSAGLDPYFQGPGLLEDHCFPPPCYLVLSGLYRFLPGQATLETLQSNAAAVTLAFSLFTLSALVFITSLSALSHAHFRSKAPVVLSMLVSGGLVFTIERGNAILFAAIFIALFLLLKDRESTTSKALAALCLSLATATKIYPCVFGLFWLSRKNIKWLAIAALLSIFLVFAPLAFFQHNASENITQLIAIASRQSKLYFEYCHPNLTLPSYINAFSKVFSFDLSLVVNILIICTKALAIACFAFTFRVKEQWEKMFLVAAGLIFFAAQINWYAILYVYPAIFLYLTESTLPVKRKDWIYIISFCFMLTPLQFGTDPISHHSVNAAICSGLIYVVALTIIFGTWRKKSQQT